MKLNISRICAQIVALTIGVLNLQGQAAFQNLAFESPVLPLIPDGSFEVPIANAIPAWQGYLGTNQTDRVVYDTLSLGAAAISLHDSASLKPPIQGNYSLILQPQFNPNNVPGLMNAAVAQSGQTPANVRSLRFYSGSEYMQASFAGQNIHLVQLGITGSYLILGGDISAFAGQTGELRFTMPSVAFSYNIPYLDNIIFSPQAIPEPGVFGLFTCGAWLLRWRLRGKPKQ